MDIRIIKTAENAVEARGIAVVIDVFRAFSVESYVINNNVKELIAVGDKDLAYEYKEKNPNVILIGERKGVKLPGFDFGNAPSTLINEDFTGKTVVHTTSAGTQGLVNSKYADEIITGCFLNAKAIVKYIKEKGYETVSLVCTNLGSKDAIEEDTLCALYIKSLLEDRVEDFDERIDNLRYTSGAKFFKEELKDVFPREDFDLCIKRDIFNFVLQFNKINESAGIIKRIDIK